MAPTELQRKLQQYHRKLLMEQQIALHHRLDDKENLCGEEEGPRRWPIPPRNPMLPLKVNVELHNRNLWQQFHTETTEMIITKSGRRMFPSVQISVNGLQKRERYYVLMEITPASDRRHKYCGNSGGGGGGDDDNSTNKSTGGWTFAGPAELQPHFERRIYMHPDSPSTGEHWMQNVINFSKLKLTNNVVDHRTKVLLTSMHKYVPQIWIIRCDDARTVHELFSYPASSFTFKETEFIAVTAYQNENITKLKIDNNPFAKGFRETGQSRCKRKYSQTDAKCSLDYARTYDEDNFSFESDSSQNEKRQIRTTDASIDSLAQKSKTSEDDDAEEATFNEAKRRTTTAEDEHEDEVQPQFHRPWLDSALAKAEPLPPPIFTSASTTMRPFTELPSLNWTYEYCLHYINAHENALRRYPPYYGTSSPTYL